jgi:hypothetical protein
VVPSSGSSARRMASGIVWRPRWPVEVGNGHAGVCGADLDGCVGISQASCTVSMLGAALRACTRAAWWRGACTWGHRFVWVNRGRKKGRPGGRRELCGVAGVWAWVSAGDPRKLVRKTRSAASRLNPEIQSSQSAEACLGPCIDRSTERNLCR